MFVVDYDLVYIDFPSESFKWANGLYIILGDGNEPNTYKICALNEKGELSKFEDGRLDYSITGKNNKGIKRTGLKIKIE